MSDTETYPLLFEPVYQNYIWGGHRIPEIYGRKTTQEICAESWEISSRSEGMSVVRNGPLKGRTLLELTDTLRQRLLGTVGMRRDETTRHGKPAFPLLIKLIDSNRRLSVQVHPNGQSAARYGGEPKTEMWVILEAADNAKVYAGLKPGIGRATFERAIADQGLERMLASVSVKPGQAIFIPGGLVHAIGEGCLLLEIQQNSNTTYRVYDWGRVGHDGKPRELHVAQALQAIDWDRPPAAPISPALGNDVTGDDACPIVQSPHFNVWRHDVASSVTVLNDGRSFHALFVASGSVRIEGNGSAEAVTAGTSVLLPAEISKYRLEAVDGPASLIRTSLV